MFRRRTDQVYSTLQQVQRRITEQTGMGEPDISNTPPVVTGRQPLEQALPSGSPPMVPPVSTPVSAQPSPISSLAPTAPILPNPIIPVAPSGSLNPGVNMNSSVNPGNFPSTGRIAPNVGKRYVLQLSGDMAMLLMVVWIASMAAMFMLGQYWRSVGGAGLAAGPAGNREVPVENAGPRQGDAILLLQSVPTATVESLSFFEESARKLNDYVKQNSSRGWKPYFGVRKPINGGVELAYGLVNGTWGINQNDFADIAKILSQPQSKGGAGYGQARWIKVDN
jgi:hypothetical protein